MTTNHTVYDLGVTEIRRSVTSETTSTAKGTTDFFTQDTVRITCRPLAFPALMDFHVSGTPRPFSPHRVTVTTYTGAPDPEDADQSPISHRQIEVSGRWLTAGGKIVPSKSHTASASFRPGDPDLPGWLASLADAAAPAATPSTSAEATA